MKKISILFITLFILVNSCKKETDPDPEPQPNSNVPVVKFSADKTNFYETDIVTFSDESTNNPIEWYWTFEGGDPSTSEEQFPSVIYYNKGSFDVKLYVSNGDGAASVTKTDYINFTDNIGPNTDFTANATSIQTGTSVLFTDISTGNPASWDWVFDGGTPSASTDQNPSVSYNEAGVYSVTLTATNFSGYTTVTKNLFIIVTEGGSTFPGQIENVAGGSFNMGETNILYQNPDETPIHSVSINTFQIGTYEITKSQYVHFMNQVGVNSSGYLSGNLYVDVSYLNNSLSYENGEFVLTNDGNEPMNYVTWAGARAYCTYYGGRLPSEAEWEYAARGGVNNQNYQFAGSDDMSTVGWQSNTGGYIHDIGLKLPNELGIYDMSGNVWEWCNDWYGSTYYQTSTSSNPTGPFSGTDKILRGGSYDNTLASCTVGNRNQTSLSTFHGTIGFRIAF